MSSGQLPTPHTAGSNSTSAQLPSPSPSPSTQSVQGSQALNNPGVNSSQSSTSPEQAIQSAQSLDPQNTTSEPPLQAESVPGTNDPETLGPAERPNQWRAHIYRLAEGTLSLLVLNPNDRDAKTQIDTINYMIMQQNQAEGASTPAEINRYTLDYNWLQVQYSSVKPFLDRLEANPLDTDAMQNVQRMDILMAEKCTRRGWPASWKFSVPQQQPQAGSSQPQPQEGSSQQQPQEGSSQPQLQASSSQQQPLAGSSQPQTQAASSQPQTQAASSQQQPLAGSSQPQTQAASSQQPQTSTTSLPQGLMDVDSEPEVLARFSNRDVPDGVRTELVAWADKPDVEIVQLGNRNAPVFHIKQGAYSSESKTVDMNMPKQRRGDNKQANVYEYNGQHVVGLSGVAWIVPAGYQSASDDPHCLNLIRAEYINRAAKGRYPITYVRVNWTDQEKTWETRTTVRRLWSKNPKIGDREILRCAELYVKKFEASRGNVQSIQNRSATPFGNLAHAGQSIYPVPMAQSMPPAPPGQSIPPVPPGQSMPPAATGQSMPLAPPGQSMPLAPPGQSMPPAPQGQSIPPVPPGQSISPAQMAQSSVQNNGQILQTSPAVGQVSFQEYVMRARPFLEIMNLPPTDQMAFAVTSYQSYIAHAITGWQ